MGAGQIGGIATLLEIDFNNAAGFVGTRADVTEGQYIVHYFSHALIFCLGTLIEPHVVLTPAICVFGERYKFSVHAGTHQFLLYAGVSREAQHICTHRDYNHSMRWTNCETANLALLVLGEQFLFNQREPKSEYVINRLRYGIKPGQSIIKTDENNRCHYYGWGSRRNGYLVPLLIHLRRVNVVLLPQESCAQIWNYNSHFLCIQQHPCKTSKFGTLCPDDLGSIMECSGYAVGMMVSRLIDRPCGIGFLDLTKFNKFLTCGVDDAREVVDHEGYMSFDYTTVETAPTPTTVTVPEVVTETVPAPNPKE